MRISDWSSDVCSSDLVFNIVAVSDFNFGAMENKGLNIFNSRYILADPETAPDADYDAVEGVAAHEYFHNWRSDERRVGNRCVSTCRARCEPSHNTKKIPP